MADLRVHTADLGVHDAPICVFTMRRSGCSRGSGTRSPWRRTLTTADSRSDDVHSATTIFAPQPCARSVLASTQRRAAVSRASRELCGRGLFAGRTSRASYTTCKRFAQSTTDGLRSARHPAYRSSGFDRRPTLLLTARTSVPRRREFHRRGIGCDPNVIAAFLQLPLRSNARRLEQLLHDSDVC